MIKNMDGVYTFANGNKYKNEYRQFEKWVKL